ncbi:MAG: HTH-type transcriptional activator RhaR [Chroococcidiopsis sp. SAG 2025]|uniref:helix-turn-helix transcriptional regulator n=1 Tax=Chroococcidiopsis sp. SAG 2025 TaxID=171389 RepID=UPI0029370CEC|nr:AraC family transcriptional regulator [Chroococcidiopsis sp. SAG 2025]MDV2998173.1 HTH-type transcriptional activator RhaR [Chroococcidiopsis sp. SAG 2025]
MTISLTSREEEELWDEAAQNSLQPASIEPFELYVEMPSFLGSGYDRYIELHPQLELTIIDHEYRDDYVENRPASNHPLQFSVFLLGIIQDDERGWISERNTVISGGGIQREMKVKHFSSPRMVGINIEMSPDLLATFFPGKDGGILPELKLLAKENDWQTLVYPEMTPAVRFLTQQIFNCPYQGITKRIYLEAKVLELIALQVSPLLAGGDFVQISPLKSDTIGRIHHARQIIFSRLENPPSLVELAALVGVSDRTLRRGFRELFGTTVFGYLTQMRMEKAEQFLRESNMTVAEVANLVGYTHLGHFAAAFKRQYGITPRECLLGKKSVSGL